jgi:hypothetical protein
MVKVFLATLALISFSVSARAETAELHVSPHCPFCVPAKAVINKLIAEGYDVKIIMDSRERVFPTLIIRIDGKVVRYVGLRTETFYRNVIPKTGRGVDQPLVVDLSLRN